MLLVVGCTSVTGGNRTAGAPPRAQTLRIAFRPNEVLRYRYQGTLRTPGPGGAENVTVVSADTSWTAQSAERSPGSAPAAGAAPAGETWSIDVTSTNLRWTVALAGLSPSAGSNPGPLKLQLLVADDGRVLLTNSAAASLGTIGAYPNVAVLPPIYGDTPGVEQFLAVLPAHPVKAGDTWQNDFTNQFGSFARRITSRS